MNDTIIGYLVQHIVAEQFFSIFLRWFHGFNQHKLFINMLVCLVDENHFLPRVLRLQNKYFIAKFVD